MTINKIMINQLAFKSVTKVMNIIIIKVFLIY